MIHLTEKPVELAARAMEYSSKPGENELDLTTLVLLAWLDHVSGVLVKAERYARSWAWLRLNVDHVLHNLRRV